MQTVIPFRAWRYSGEQAGDLERLVAPPYDVIGPELQSRLYARSRYNVVRVDLGMSTPVRQRVRQPLHAGGLPARGLEGGPASWSRPRAQPHLRGGSVHGARRTRAHAPRLPGAVRLSEFGEGVVFPHEQTLSGPKEDRFRLMLATEMSLSPVFLLYDLPGDEITAAWQADRGRPHHRPWSWTPRAAQGDHHEALAHLRPPPAGTVGQILADARFIIADGHHRYETALRYQDTAERRRAAKPLPSAQDQECAAAPEPQAYDYVLAYLSNMADPGLAIYGTHRLVRASIPNCWPLFRRTWPPHSRWSDSRRRERRLDAGAAAEAIGSYLEAHPRGAFGLWGPALTGPTGCC